ncbi:MAG: 4-hydroxythreonine-4-phosphate dehydrogenase PdxA [Bacteroidales bacterium]|jgi:4-hydroxythreonine-4-phosphate dehydrogenase|nr:4-hydroxythreonine-4-phosphate dehydrogenase PdxA [Bacteroidales bacterium]MDD2264062.1 4-hydroxythreonine-4-phosphate dehydrogenase PdxA [Bacteroidales bacterium]MDD2831296.1 4-hydroxythreonine-4-phosphate dehydrogenase PdxA [Bacteroidales bacterium]MDD3208591.1 4-hydroxythreonine-4-phosphate dehydrogenase PdxA [Bacteroidales bacterium]MDD3697154.1 4-hydroxythreonine-4-phosphate dehydrogenase PdxA [Bacteroidales bacterium]
MHKKIIVGITQGDTNGIGYEVLIKALADSRINELCTPVIYGSSRLLGYYKKLCSGVENFNVHITQSASDLHFRMVNLIPCVSEQFMAEPGKMTEEGAQAALQSLERAIEDLRDGKIQVLVTAPFNKQNMNREGFAFPGHTEYLADAFGIADPLMVLCSPGLRTGVVTGHIPVSSIPSALSKEKIREKIMLLNETLKNDFTIRQPRIAVLGLNPHAGDGGLIGTEEQEIITPAIEETNKNGILAFGPYPADGFYAVAEFRKFDAVLAMYHDQGLIPFKALSFSQGVNFTAGLPVIRTSPDHGTAYRLAGEDKASPESMLAAIFMACDVYRTRKRNKEAMADRLHEG